MCEFSSFVIASPAYDDARASITGHAEGYAHHRSCLQDVQAAELQHAELEEAAAERQQHHKEESKAAAAVAKQRQDLEADVAAAQEQLKQLQQQAQVRWPYSNLLYHVHIWLTT